MIYGEDSLQTRGFVGLPNCRLDDLETGGTIPGQTEVPTELFVSA